MQWGAGAVTAAIFAVVLGGCIWFDPATVHTVSTDPAVRTRSSALADVTGDGLADPLVMTDDGLSRLEFCCEGCLVVRETLPDSAGASFLTGEFSGDGVDDVVVFGEPTVAPRIYFGGPAGSERPAGLVPEDSAEIMTEFFAAVQFPEQGAYPAGTGDFDGDGVTDLVLRTVWGVSYKLGGGDWTSSQRTEVLSVPGSKRYIDSIRIADLDGDGADEILTRVVPVLPSPTVTYVALLGGPLSIDTGALRLGPVADFDGDGADEFLADPTGGGSLERHVWEFTGTAFEPVELDVPVDLVSQPSGLTVADFNGNGHLDLVGTSSADNSLSWWSGAGRATFGKPFGEPRAFRTLAHAPGSVDSGDVDGDGLPDLLIANPDEPGGQVTLLLNGSIVG